MCLLIRCCRSKQQYCPKRRTGNDSKIIQKRAKIRSISHKEEKSWLTRIWYGTWVIPCNTDHDDHESIDMEMRLSEYIEVQVLVVVFVCVFFTSTSHNAMECKKCHRKKISQFWYQVYKSCSRSTLSDDF